MDLKTLTDKHCELAYKIGLDPEQWLRFGLHAYVPQERQMEFHRAARDCDYDDGPMYVAYGGTRGQAKSHAEFAQAVIDDMQRYPGLKFLYLRKIQKRAGESMDDLRRKVLKYVPHEYKNSTITLPNGSFMIMGGFRSDSELDSYLGQEYDGIVTEDATTLAKNKFGAVDLCLRTSRTDYRPRMYLSANPGGSGHMWFKKMFVDPWMRKEETTTRFIHTILGDNKFLDPSYTAKLNALQGWERRAYRDGDFSIMAGQYFDNWHENIHIIDDIEIQHSWTYILAMDYGHTHWNVIYLIGVDGEDTAYVLDEHAKRRWQVHQHVDAIHAMLHRNGLRIDQVRKKVASHDIWAKKQDDGTTIADMYAKLGINWSRAKQDRINGAAEILRRLGTDDIVPRLYVLRRCHMLIDCIPELVHDPDRSEDVLKVNADPETGEGGDDAYDAARYGIMEASARRIQTGRLHTQPGERDWMDRINAKQRS